MKYDLVIKDCDWLALKLGPVLLDMLTMGSVEEADTYEYEESEKCLPLRLTHGEIENQTNTTHRGSSRMVFRFRGALLTRSLLIRNFGRTTAIHIHFLGREAENGKAAICSITPMTSETLFRCTLGVQVILRFDFISTGYLAPVGPNVQWKMI